MSTRSKTFGAAAAGIGLAAASYGTLFATTWFRYGRTRDEITDPLLDRFMPVYEVAEHHQIGVSASPEITFNAAMNIDMMESPVVRAIFKMRECALRGKAGAVEHPRALLEQMKSFGWTILDEVPGREIVFGAVTQPWIADPEFRSIPPAEFKAFHESDFVKIAWTIRADPGDGGSIASTDTRVCTTDAASRAKFRRYWSLVRPGVVLIRRIGLRITKRDAELNAR